MTDRRHLRPFEILIRENADMLTTYLEAVVRDRDAVDDLFQETFLTAWRRIEECDLSRPFGPWLRGIARRLILARQRGAARNVLVCDEAVLNAVETHLGSIERRPGDQWLEKIERLSDCIEQLPEHLRETIHERYLEDRKVSEISARLGVGLEALKKRLQRARALLADCLERGGLLGGEAG